MTPTVPMLSVRGLVKAYHNRSVLDGVDLDVAEHQVVVLIGASGSGKSTLLRCIDLIEDIDTARSCSTAAATPRNAAANR